MPIFKLTVLESLVLLLNLPGHLRVGMTSAHQAGILELIFKEKSRGLKTSQEKGSSDNWKGRGICKEQKGQCGIGQARRNGSGDGLWKMEKTILVQS